MRLAIAMTIVAGCRGPVRQPAPPARTDTLRPEVVWIVPAGKPVGAVGDDIVAFDADHERAVVQATAMRDGRPRWRLELPGQAWFTNDHIVVGERGIAIPAEQAIYAVRDGRLAWKQAWASAHDDAFASLRDGIATCHERELAMLAWRDGVPATWRTPCELVAGDGDVLAITRPTSARPVARIDAATGATRWLSQVPAEALFVSRDLVLASSTTGLVALRADTGLVAWELAAPRVQAIAVAGDRIALWGVSWLRVVDRRTGAELARVDDGPMSGQFALDATHLAWIDNHALVTLDLAGTRTRHWLPEPSPVLWLTGDDAIIAAPAGLARIHLAGGRPSLDGMSAPAHLDALIDEPLGVDRFLFATIRDRRDFFAFHLPHLYARLADIPEDRATIVATIAERLDDPRIAGPLAARLPRVVDPRARLALATTLARFSDASSTPVLVALLADPEVASVASAGLVHAGTPDAIDAAIRELDRRLATPPPPVACTGRCTDAPGDRDRDGITDAVEAFLGTNPDAADSDGDGQPDATDPCPLLARGATDPRLQAAYLAVLDTVHEPGATVAGAGLAGQCLRSPWGPLLHTHGVELPGPTLSLEIADSGAAVEGARATVNASLGCGKLCGFGYRIDLVFRRGRWLCERVQSTGAS